MIVRHLAWTFLLLFTPTFVFSQTPSKAPLGGPGRGLSLTDPRAVKFEAELVTAINERRKAAKLEALVVDEKLRALARQQSEGVAKGERAPNALEEIIKNQKLAPLGFRAQYVAGTKAREVLKELDKDKLLSASFRQEFARIAVGAFWVPDDPAPYVQATLVVVTEADPMAGKPGLTLEETNAVMKEASSTIKALCYDTALRANPNFGGHLVFQIVIGAKGNVDSAKLNVKTNNEIFDGCALNVAKGLVFPAPYKGRPVTLNHPMRFLPPHGEKKVGRLAEGHISRVFRLAEPSIRACYDGRVKTKPNLRGSLALYLLVGVNGDIRSLVVERDEPNDPALTTCVKGEVQKLKFPTPEFGGEAEVRFPIRFEPPPPATP